jgi:hypothetical protein
MKILIILILFLPNILTAQQRDLNFYLETAKTNSPFINKNRNDNKIVELDLKQIKAIFSKPEITIEAGVLFAPIISHNNNSNRFEWISSGADKYTGFDLAFTDGGQYQAIITAKQPLFTGSSIRTYSKKADISRQINENRIALTIHETEQLVIHQYILCIKSKIQAENSLSMLKLLNEQTTIMQKLVENAVYKQSDLMLLKIEYQNYELEYKTNCDDRKVNLYDLNLLCGINDTNFVDIQDIDLKLKQNTRSESQFLMSYKLDSLNILSDQNINELKYKPQLSLFANAGMNAVYVPSVNRLGFSTGITFGMNIFDGNQKKIQREKATIDMQSLEFEKSNFFSQITMTKYKIRNQFRSLNEKIVLSEIQFNQYYNLLKMYSSELSRGEISIMDYKNLIKDIAAKNQELLLLKMEKQALINLYNYWNY